MLYSLVYLNHKLHYICHIQYSIINRIIPSYLTSRRAAEIRGSQRRQTCVSTSVIKTVASKGKQYKRSENMFHLPSGAITRTVWGCQYKAENTVYICI